MDGDDLAAADLDEEIDFDDEPDPDHTSGMKVPRNLAELDDLVAGFVADPHVGGWDLDDRTSNEEEDTVGEVEDSDEDLDE